MGRGVGALEASRDLEPGQVASRAVPVPGPKAEQGVPAAMMDLGTRAAMADKGTQAAMADQVAMVDLGTRAAMADQGTQAAMALGWLWLLWVLWRAGRNQRRRRWAGQDQQRNLRALAMSRRNLRALARTALHRRALARSRHWRALARSRHWRAPVRSRHWRAPWGAGSGAWLQTIPHNPLTSPGAPGGAQVARNWTEPAETKTSWAGPEKMSWEGPAETKMSWTGPAETKMSWTGPAETKMSWVGPAETLVGWFRLGTGNFPTPVDPLSPTQSCGVWEIHRALVICPEPKQMEDCHVGELRHRGEPAEFPGELHEGEIPPAKGEGCRRRTPSPWRRICLIFPSLEVGYSVTLLHGEPGTRRRGLQQTGVLMDEERRRYRNTGKDINISVDIYNNRQETRGRTDY